MTGADRYSDGAPVPPPKSGKSGLGIMSKVGRSKRKDAKRMSQFVEPQALDEEDVPGHSRLDVIDQLDISGLTGGSCTLLCVLIPSVPSRFTVRCLLPAI